MPSDRELEDLIASLPPVTADSPPLHRVAHYAIEALRAADELGDDGVADFARCFAILVGRKLARSLSRNGRG